MELLRRLTTAAPEPRSFHYDKPSLLVCWWCTIYALTVILFRVCGRYVRAEKLFVEDGIMLLAIIPLFIRMAFVHVILLYGTNNVIATGLTALAIQHREIGSQLVLASRIMYAGYLWAVKYSHSTFLRTLTANTWQKSHDRILKYLHISLAVTFLVVVISDLSGCQPFSHFWQVTPDPGPQCRQGSIVLLTIGILHILTNVTLVLFPIPIILKSQISHRQKTTIILRLSLPLLSIAFTIYQLPAVVAHNNDQRFRSLLASFDILIATVTTNAVVLASLLQDKGYKKVRYRRGALDYGVMGRRLGRSEGRWRGDEELMRVNMDRKRIGDLGIVIEEMNMPSELKEIKVNSTWEVKVERVVKE